MLFDGVNLMEGSEIQNATVAFGATFPANPNEGELFVVNSTSGGNVIGLHVYEVPGNSWVRQLQTGDSLAGTLPDVITAGTYKSVTVSTKGIVTSGTNPTTLAGFGITDAQPYDADLFAIGEIVATSGLLKKTGANIWVLDTNTYLTANQTITMTGDITGSGITSITIALATVNVAPQTNTFNKITVNGKGLVTATTPVFDSDITSVLGYTPYNSTNPAGYTASTGTVTTASIVTANGVSGTVATASTTPAITIVLGAITPSSVAATGTVTASNLSGTNTGDNAANTTYANDYRLANFVAGTNYLAPNGSAASLTSFPTLNQNTTGNAATATTLATGRTISATGDATGTSAAFDGSANTSIALTLANSGVTANTYGSATLIPVFQVDAKGRITSVTNTAVTVSTISATNVTGIMTGAQGGTGVDNTGKTITLAGNLALSGAFNLTFTSSASTNVALPTTGTLATLAGTETLINKTLTGSKFIGESSVTVDKGSVSSGTVTFDYSASTSQKLTVAGALTINVINWAATGNASFLNLKLVNAGSAAVTITPTINWIKPDGTTTTSIATYMTSISRSGLQTSGTDQLILWTDDAGTTIYGKVL